MKLEYIKLTNFRQHRQSFFRFSDGLTAVIGANGSGKTTILEGLAFALYGSNALRGKTSEVLTYGLGRSSNCEIELSFEQASENYRLVRTLNDAQLYRGGGADALATGNRGVNDYLTELLRMSREEFVATFCTEQKSLEFLSSQKGAAERERFIVRMMGYDRLEEIQEKLREEKKGLKAELQVAENDRANPEILNARYQEEKQGIKTAEENWQRSRKELDSLEAELTVAKKDYTAWETQAQNFEQLQNQLNQISSEVELRQKNILRLNEKITVVENNLKAVSENSGNEDFEAQIKDLEENAQRQEEEIRAIENQRLEQATTLATQQKMLGLELEKKRKSFKDYSVLKFDQPCPLCGQELGESFKKVQYQIGLEVKKIETEIGKLPNADLENTEQEAKLRMELLKIKNLLKNLQSEKIRRQQIAIEADNLLRLVAERTENEKVVGRELERQKVINQQIEKTNFDAKAFRDLKVKVETLTSLCSRLRIQTVSLHGELDKLKSLAERTQAEILVGQEKLARFKKSKEEFLLLEDGDQALTDFRRHLNAAIRPRLSELASSFIVELSDGRYSAVEIGEDFSPRLVEDGTIKTVISGGEEDLLNLCLRLSLSALLAERAGQAFNLLILDEVFGSLDENRRQNVLTLLDRLKNRFEQIIMITHLEDIREGAKNLIYLTYDEGTHSSKAIVPEELGF